ncbi:MAG: nucleotidyltransferase domain-containing protein [Nanoarchaeota archaeon]|nr:nucleotidyltransferase domain-containing protein [Nanoarchaeota archaeon]MBU0977220.1 nucleotidyltransferase domain-containing protein [Nanoarchaeota archaeon]
MDYKVINKNSLRIIEIVSGGREYFNEVHKKTGIKSKNNLLKNINVLVGSKILIKEEMKANTYFSLNYANNAAIAALNLINQLKFEKLPFKIKKSISECLFAVRPAMAVLFGSYAKGNYGGESDIDLIMFNVPKERRNKVGEVSKQYGVKINVVWMDFGELNNKTESIKHMFKTGYPLIGEGYFYNEFKEI